MMKFIAHMLLILYMGVAVVGLLLLIRGVMGKTVDRILKKNC